MFCKNKGEEMITIIEKNGFDCNEMARYEVSVLKDGQIIAEFSAGDMAECPEDASLERDLKYAYQAVRFFKIGYEAGRNNEGVVFEREEWEND